MAAAGAFPGDEMDREALSRMKAGEHRHNLLQGICRANVRNVANGVCGDCEAYVIGKAGKDTKALLAETFPGAVVRDWRPYAAELTGRSRDVAEEIKRRFAAGGAARVRKIDIRNAVGFSTSQELTQVLARPGFQHWLSGEGLALERREVLRAT